MNKNTMQGFRRGCALAICLLAAGMGIQSARAAAGITLKESLTVGEATQSSATDYTDSEVLYGQDGVCIALWSSKAIPGGEGLQDRELYITRSTNGGETWSEPNLLNSDGPAEGGNDSQPTLATDGAGTWIAIWTSESSLNGSGADYDLRFAKSVDNGVTWSATALVGTNATTDAGYDLTPSLATDGHGRWIVSWRSNENLGGLTDGDDDIFYAVSDDAGGTWSAPKALNGNANADQGLDYDPRLAADGAGNWIAVWHSDRIPGSGGQDRDILFARSTNNGQSWSFPAALNPDAMNDSLTDIQPDILARDGTWICAWSGDGAIDLSRSTDGGQTWGAPAKVDSPEPANDYQPRLTARSGGRWAVGWIGSYQSAKASASSDNGVTWSEDLMPSARNVSDVAVALDPATGRFTLATTIRLGNPVYGITAAFLYLYGSPNIDVGDVALNDVPGPGGLLNNNCADGNPRQRDVVFQNTGVTTWKDSDNYQVAIVRSSCSFAPNQSYPLGGDIAPSQGKYFAFNYIVTTVAETCSLDFQMTHNGVEFGTPGHFDFNILPVENVSVDHVDYPSTVSTGESGTITVTVTNLTCGTWAWPYNADPTRQYFMKVIEDAGDLITPEYIIPVGEIVPLAQGTFAAPFTAGAAEGTHVVRLQMARPFASGGESLFGPVVEAVIDVRNGVPPALDFANDTFNWFGGTAGGSGDVGIDGRGICMTAPELGDNVVGWVSPQAYCSLRDSTVYRMRIETSTDQTAEGAIPFLDFIYDNFPSNTYGGELMILDNTGGANGIGRPQGRTSFELWAAPNAVETLQWRGLLSNGVPGENDNSAFTPQADAANDMRLVIRLNDIGSGGINANLDAGTVCVRRLEITAFNLANLTVNAPPLYAPPINSNTHGAERFDQTGGGTAEFDDAAAEVRYALLAAGTGARKTLFPWDRTEGAPSLFYPAPWVSDQLLKGTVGVRSRVDAAEGIDPVDVIGVLFDVPTVEVQAVHLSNRGNPGNMNLAASPRRIESTGGAAQPYTAYYYTHNRTAIDTTANPGADRLRVQGDFINLSDLAPQGQGADPFAATSLKLEGVALP